jgi:hypothetical protein
MFAAKPGRDDRSDDVRHTRTRKGTAWRQDHVGCVAAGNRGRHEGTFERRIALDTWTHLTDAAAAGANATRSMVAARGRAARLGERSLGHTDPGAASAVIILQAMMKSLVDAPIAEDTHFLTFSVNTLPDLLPCAKIPSRCAGPRRKRCCERKSRLIDAFSQR